MFLKRELFFSKRELRFSRPQLSECNQKKKKIIPILKLFFKYIHLDDKSKPTLSPENRRKSENESEFK